MKMLVAMVLTLALSAEGAWAQSADTMTVKDFRSRPEQAQVYMVLGAIALTSELDIVCPAEVTVGEWRAALVHRQLDVTRTWIRVLLELMDERGCKGQQVKGDA